jgi:fucose 4-O-acetylase-like acetyltransferase
LWKVVHGGSELRGPFTVFWFVPCLLAARVLFNAVGAQLSDARTIAWLAVAAGLLIVAEVLGDWTDWSPLGLLTVPMAMVLLWAGWAARDVEWRGWRLALLVPVAAAGLAVLPTINMKAGDYGWPVVSIAAAVATSLLLFRAAQLLDAAPEWATAALKLLGSASLVIMYLHVPVIHYGAPLLGKGWLLALALVVPVGVYVVFRRFAWTRRVFLAG